MKKIIIAIMITTFSVAGIAYGVTNTTKKTTTKTKTKVTAKVKAAPTPAVKAKVTPTPKVAQGSIADGTYVFTLTELAKYNGQNGTRAYVAVDGIVYDVTDAWGGGFHNGAQAGTDVSQLILQSPHGKKMLDRVQIVGKLKK